MKPPEILSMIEEAAGTRMFETKKVDYVSIRKEEKRKGVEKITEERRGGERKVLSSYHRLAMELVF